MATIARVEHGGLPTGLVTFDDDELIAAEWPHRQIVVEQLSQSNYLTPVHVGDSRIEFGLLFSIFYQSTLEKLQQIRALRDEFTFFPALLEEPATVYTVFWPEDPPFRERWVRGRRQAHWQFDVVWKETRLVECLPFAIS